MSLADELNEYPAADEPQYTPRVEWDGTSGTIQTGPKQGDFDPRNFGAVLDEFGLDPATHQLELIGGTKWLQSRRVASYLAASNRSVNGTEWTREFEDKWLYAFRYRFTIAAGGARAADIEAIVKAARVERRSSNGPHWFVFQASDTQLGKRSRDGGTDEIVERYVQAVESAVAELKQLKRHGIAGVQISMPGDCIEGWNSQAGKNQWLTAATVPEQSRILRRLMMFTIEQFAPLAEQVLLHVVNGNHDEHQRTQNTYPGDGWATECAITVSDALKMNPLSFGHVTVQVPNKWSGHMTVPVGDTVVTVIHGHQWKQWPRALAWLSEQAVHNQPPGAADVVQYGHFHTWRVESHQTKTLIGSPTFDCGSDHYRNAHGAESRRGGLTYLLRAGEVSRMTLV